MIRARAITLVETVISTAIIATAMVAALGVVAESARGRRVLEETRVGVINAQQIMGEVLQREYEDSAAESSDLGAEPGESAPAQYDDVDDYHRHTRACGGGMQAEVAVTWADPSSPSKPGAAGSGLKRIVVTITKNRRNVTRLEALKSPGPPELRACCLAAATCEQTTRAQCDAAGGTWGAVGSACWTTACPSITAGLTVYWEFSELLGNNVNDTIGNANGNAQNGPTRTSSGAVGRAMTFDGSNDYVDAGNASHMLDITGSITIAAWVNKSSNAGYDCVVGKGPRGTDCNFWLGTSGAYPAFAWSNKGAHECVATNVSLPTGQWRHVAATYDAATSTVTLYASGVKVGQWTTANGVSTNAQDVCCGSATKTSDFFHGGIDDVRIYTRALSPSEIAWLASQSSGGVSLLGIDINLGGGDAIIGITP